MVGRGLAPAASDNRDSNNGVKILLSKNYRSRAGILDAVNLVFGKIMSKEFGEMDYTENEMLIPGRAGSAEHYNTEHRIMKAEPGDDSGESFDIRNPKPGHGETVELNIIDMSGAEPEEDEDNPVQAQVEAQFIAGRVAELVSNGYMIPDGKEGERPVEYSDIVILLRSIRNKAWHYASALAERGIPVDLPGGEGFFETIEISTVLSLLSVIDNPMQDIPLASALSGPIYGFTADELAEIRTGGRDTDFYGALVKAAETNEKCAAFLSEINEFQLLMPDMTADRFIWHVYNKTGLIGLVGAMRGGDRRRCNLILLAEAARKFEQNGYRGLFGFLTYVRGLQERGAELIHDGGAISDVVDSNAVRIMSIHKSKGLEFPVVFLAGTSKRLNNRDAQQSLVMHPQLGVGPMRIDRQRRIEYTTLARMAVQSRLTSEMMAEEMRILYVAMTRAREKLIITATYADAAKEIDKVSKIRGERAETAHTSLGISRIPPQALKEIKNMAGWIMAAISDGNSQFIIKNITAADIAESTSNESPTSIPSSGFQILSSNNEVDILRKRFSFIYPNAYAPDLPSKLTVTGLRGWHIDSEAAVLSSEIENGSEAHVGSEFGIQKSKSETEAGERGKLEAGNRDLESGDKMSANSDPHDNRYSYRRPDFITKKTNLSASERGTALHLAMQHIDFEKCNSSESISAELKRLTHMGLLTEEQAAAVDTQKITRFFESEIGKRVLKAENVMREFKFSLLSPAEEYFPEGGDDKILLQGIIDCFFEENGELIVVDFKTDRVTADTLEERAALYAPQLEAYSNALERITTKRVKDRIIYFFEL